MPYPKFLGRWLAGALLGAFVLLSTIYMTNSFTLIRGATSQQMEPIIEAYGAALSASGSNYEAAWNKADDLLDSLAHNQSRVGDEASAALICYYLGEHPGEELVENVASRGPRELPYIEKYRRRRPALLRLDLDFMLLDSESCHFLLDEAATAIKKTKK